MSIGDFVCQEWIRRKRRDERQVAEPPCNPRPVREPDLPLAEAVASLSREMQQLLALRHDCGMSCEEIARELGRPLGSVTKTLSRAYEQLRERLVKR